MAQVVDPEVSRAKFDREVAAYRDMEATYRKRGWLLLDADFPEIFVVFAATKIRPAPIVAGVVVDFKDYDLQPPSVRFVDPFTREKIIASDLQFQMLRRPPMPGVPPEAIAAMIQQGALAVSQMIQANRADDFPFICLPGVREYHDNPAHTGDSWLLHRGSGEGSLAFILEKIWMYGVDPLSTYNLQIQAKVVGVIPQAQGIPE
ncbi:putative metal-binding protein [Bradyrhizobium sp. CCBAU 21360]|uniref:putative metal-binding protein n=1 Tax=Bradyrhizobium sp. CCBAU 21360 TaxID=1325081 RepID=UPI0023066B7F|nr:putative metal-binding protein [Bradyrhizobium sp. CCBAU 21360]